jgi:hypothetical protein
MTKDATKEDMLEEIYKELLKDLLYKIKHGEASPSDRNVARLLLKDAQVTCDPENTEPDLEKLNDIIDEDVIRYQAEDV